MKVSGKEAALLVDLGTVTLVSGVQSQGPPASLHPTEVDKYILLYTRWANFLKFSFHPLLAAEKELYKNLKHIY